MGEQGNAFRGLAFSAVPAAVVWWLIVAYWPYVLLAALVAFGLLAGLSILRRD